MEEGTTSLPLVSQLHLENSRPMLGAHLRLCHLRGPAPTCLDSGLFKFESEAAAYPPGLFACRPPPCRCFPGGSIAAPSGHQIIRLQASYPGTVWLLLSQIVPWVNLSRKWTEQPKTTWHPPPAHTDYLARGIPQSMLQSMLASPSHPSRTRPLSAGPSIEPLLLPCETINSPSSAD